MNKIKITAVRKADYKDLKLKYENPIQHACDVTEGQVWIADGWKDRKVSVKAPGKAFLLL